MTLLDRFFDSLCDDRKPSSYDELSMIVRKGEVIERCLRMHQRSFFRRLFNYRKISLLEELNDVNMTLMMRCVRHLPLGDE